MARLAHPCRVGKKPLPSHIGGQGKHTGTENGAPGDVRANLLDPRFPPTGQGKQGTSAAQQRGGAHAANKQGAQANSRPVSTAALRTHNNRKRRQ
ncbi:hypothetical protein NDU88_008479 [Pleurodeles waltl]|uniref:Uncharacterized protein n=1 Tax=Pleurodeles waltl TaxID=8319 RepID=A0AAV7P562_PLEWA|nr:hypothetical protein NDU88_008479 [Pleurodeles waltl]